MPRSSTILSGLASLALAGCASWPWPPASEVSPGGLEVIEAPEAGLMPAEATPTRAHRSAGSPPAARQMAGPASGSPRLFAAAPRDSVEQASIHFIDVGQGDATLFEFPCGTILIDSGGETHGDFQSTELLRSYLDAFFTRRSDLARRLDLVILTHPHVDHTRGGNLLRERFEIGHVVDNTQSQGSGGAQQRNLRSFAQESGDVAYTGVRSSDIQLDTSDDETVLTTIDPSFPVPDCERGAIRPELTLLAGHAGPETGHFKNANNHSVVVRVDFGETSVLHTGDLERHGIGVLIDKYSDTDLLDVDVFQVGHHGSHNATTVLLTELLSPKLAVFSAGDPARQEGRFNAFRFGHPNHKAVRALDDPRRGVRCNRAAIDVPVGIKGAFRDRPPVWELWTLESALFNTGWDGSVVVNATSAGDLSLVTEVQGDDHGFFCP